MNQRPIKNGYLQLNKISQDNRNIYLDLKLLNISIWKALNFQYLKTIKLIFPKKESIYQVSLQMALGKRTVIILSLSDTYNKKQ
ncbi:unnamed protein product [Paramecium octaurelia]|uniref:Uncharacterized protein n=1 Tax=Paramecium octaurelia TaxID=43137 RepID=A0A8S1SN62_PAROT|nr:unnamed protein product [Paramecium octaurelia]